MPGSWFQVSATPGDGLGKRALEARSLAPDTWHQPPMISLSNLEKSFPQADGRLYVLRRISLDVAAGDFVTIMGPSGAGKSTLLAVLGMLDGDWTGEYRLLEHAVHKMKHKDRIALGKQYVGFVFQQYHLIDDLTVAENLAMPLSYRDVKADDREAAVADTLDRFGMVAKKNLYPRQLSGGQQQLVAVARAVIHRPALLLADEPTGNLHSSQGKDIMTLFRELNAAGTTIVQVTHSEDNAKYGSRVVHLQDGWIVN
jgi:putative ABC transport system ATP-binding protein